MLCFSRNNTLLLLIIVLRSKLEWFQMAELILSDNWKLFDCQTHYYNITSPCFEKIYTLENKTMIGQGIRNLSWKEVSPPLSPP